jgi:Dockerin type I domain
MYSKSTDGGLHWAEPASIEGPPIRGPIVPVAPILAVAPDGTVGVAFYDHRNNNTGDCTLTLTTDLWFRHSHPRDVDGGLTWEEEHLSGPFRQFESGQAVGGDYEGIAPIPGGFATAFVLAGKISGSSGQHLSHPATDVFYLKLSVDAKLTGVVSRKVHGDAGSFDIDLPRTGFPGIECRSGGPNGDYTLVFTFVNELTSVGGANVTGGAATIPTVVSSAIDSSDPHQYIVNLTGVSNAQYVTVTLNNVTDSLGKFSTAVSATMGVLVGDVNQSGNVDAADVGQVQRQNNQAVTTSNFLKDVNISGNIDAADVGQVQRQNSRHL